MSSVEVGRNGRFALPKWIRQKYGLHKGTRLLITEYKGRICLVSVVTYDKPTEALYGFVKVGSTHDDPKQMARVHVKKRLAETFGFMYHKSFISPQPMGCE